MTVQSVGNNLYKNPYSGGPYFGNNFAQNFSTPGNQSLQQPNQAKNDNKLTKKQKIWLALGGAAACLTAVGFIIRGRLKAVTKLAEHIDFNPAQTMEEAAAYAKKHLKIKKFDTGNDLDLANWVNEGLTKISNHYKGKAHMPNEVLACNSDTLGKGTIAGMSSYENSSMRMNSHLYVNKEYFDNANKIIQKYIDALNFKMIDAEKGKFQMSSLPFYDFQKLSSIMNNSYKFSISKTTKMDIVSLAQNIKDYANYSRLCKEQPIKIIEDLYSKKGFPELLQKHMPEGEFKKFSEFKTLDNNKLTKYISDAHNALCEKLAPKEIPTSSILAAKRSVFDTLFHEEGHLFHHKNSILSYNEMNVIYDDAGKITSIGKYAQDFIKSPEEQFIASKVSKYAASSPLEFVAEVYARMMNGHKFTDDIMNLYKKYEGPLV
ncbi:MAG: hypothetical protein LBK53_00550 [Heliobacteriaceae bacterium]|jgi:hypothetical protein|nr:hypothetical protein [Heliobacteriaceae bacterium]